jgi:hypothetical protein
VYRKEHLARPFDSFDGTPNFVLKDGLRRAGPSTTLRAGRTGMLKTGRADAVPACLLGLAAVAWPIAAECFTPLHRKPWV